MMICRRGYLLVTNHQAMLYIYVYVPVHDSLHHRISLSCHDDFILSYIPLTTTT